MAIALGLGGCGWNASCHRFFVVEDISCVESDALDASAALDVHTAPLDAAPDGGVE